MAPVVHPMPDWGSGPAPPASKSLSLPTYRNLRPGVKVSDLLDALVDPFTQDYSTDRFDEYTYNRVYEPHIDRTSNENWTKNWSLRNCHDALWKLRTGAFLEDTEVIHWAIRLIAWAQRGAKARMGNYIPRGGDRPKRWWIAAPPFLLKPLSYADIPELTRYNMVPNNSISQPIGDASALRDAEVLAGEETVGSFNEATFTLHLVHFGRIRHWALIILHKPAPDATKAPAAQSPWTYWYLDSHELVNKATSVSQTEYNNRAAAAAAALTELLTVSGINIPGPTGALVSNGTVKMTPQIHGFECGLHVIANIFAFIRHETIGWDRVIGWDGSAAAAAMADRMTSDLLKSLHHLMGLKIANNKGTDYQIGRFAQIADGTSETKKPGRTLGVETAQAQATNAGDLAVIGNAKDIPLVRPAKGRLADLDWQSIRVRHVQRAIYTGGEEVPPWSTQNVSNDLIGTGEAASAAVVFSTPYVPSQPYDGDPDVVQPRRSEQVRFRDGNAEDENRIAVSTYPDSSSGSGSSVGSSAPSTDASMADSDPANNTTVDDIPPVPGAGPGVVVAAPLPIAKAGKSALPPPPPPPPKKEAKTAGKMAAKTALPEVARARLVRQGADQRVSEKVKRMVSDYESRRFGERVGRRATAEKMQIVRNE
ncbi:hypothetical protein QBC44DRAFT_383801 [Cladorrhinum sp. PSN332]|nr:hypothetical protein QBC44DRAFT_383801 [Cladorrhinum sp. PSN332]